MSNASLLAPFCKLLKNCKSIFELKRIHALLIAFGLSKEHPFASKILSFSATSTYCDINYAHRFFVQLPNPSIFDYNIIIRGYSNSRNPNNSLCLFVQMLQNCVIPDHMTYPFLAKACARLSELRLGMCVHGIILRNGFVLDRFILNSLMHMYGSCADIVGARKLFDAMPAKNLVSWNTMLDAYAKCGKVTSMREVFDLMTERDVVSWSSLIDGYVKDGEYMEALAIFERMRDLGPKANEVTMVSVLCACAHLGALEQGKAMHRYVVENSLTLTLVLRTSLVDMYAKCGAIEEALAVFRAQSMRQTDVLIWNAMIGGLATHGFATVALEMYREMQSFQIQPDEVTYLCLLSACAHGGLVRQAWYFFECLGKNGMTPKTEHYACMVDVLARAGQLSEAYRFVCEMPVEPTASMLGALLNGCMNHRNLDLAEIVGKKLIELEPGHDGRYVGLSNVYAIGKRWNDARTMREVMETRGVKKFPGLSFVDIWGTLHRFIAHDSLHPKSEEIYMMLDFIVAQMTSDEDGEIQECSSLLIENM
ncbi:hypothetical protein M9H77_00801 [Catharanthus roseus]|uniref:Uncharacterized protein n=1 Tax=Catharanthus roseus TaxID=4058 RepID=A0ACC0C410_CATRO|nr:hypothetical protein M9H77_00801 [Catharanthus roseus]